MTVSDEQFKTDMAKLVEMLQVELDREPTEDEVVAFIMGDSETRLDVLRGRYVQRGDTSQ